MDSFLSAGGIKTSCKFVQACQCRPDRVFLLRIECALCCCSCRTRYTDYKFGNKAKIPDEKFWTPSFYGISTLNLISPTSDYAKLVSPQDFQPPGSKAMPAMICFFHQVNPSNTSNDVDLDQAPPERAKILE